MRKTLWIACVLTALTAAVLVLVYSGRTENNGERSRTEEPVSEPPSAQAASEPPAPAVSEREPIRFSREGLAEPIARHVGRVAGPDHAQVAVREDPKGPRWVCVVVDTPDRYYELDEDWTPWRSVAPQAPTN